MSRIKPASAEVYEPLFGADAPLRQRVYANAPRLAGPFRQFADTLMRESTISGRLMEMLRLRVAFHNQCRSCMSLRYSVGSEEPLAEGVVCSLERPEEAADVTEAERAALRYADLLATDHLAIDDAVFDELRRHFSEPEIMEICFNVALFVGFGRMAASLDMTDDLPDDYRASGRIAPWALQPHSVL
ncbi:carboxymuconolactone decarboxylase family protein [Microbacterium sp. NPDC055910]|uniref:carboxymuconolactone decarboxylase family protein n=1 Tax=Microbacterium sp. NPDC055910 TaxID=3345659 RepID=UPI0035D58416